LSCCDAVGGIFVCKDQCHPLIYIIKTTRLTIFSTTSINMQIFFLSSFHLLTTANVAAAAAEPATERGVAIHAEYVGSTCVANGCKRTTSITPGIYCSSCLLPPIGNRAVITAKLDVDHV
jgi:hypothetical protein